ncbi:hypothetical protein Tco_0045912 [Tanacetum coccineum]
MSALYLSFSQLKGLKDSSTQKLQLAENLNKNDTKDMYLLIMNGKVPDYAETRLLWSLSVVIRSLVIWKRVHDFQLGIESYQQKVNLTTPTISFPGVKKHKMFSIIYEPVHGFIYKNSKKEKRVMSHSEIYKFCDATLNRVLEGLRSYNNDVKYGYVQRELTNDEVEYLKLFEEEIEVRLKYRNQMRRWEMLIKNMMETYHALVVILHHPKNIHKTEIDVCPEPFLTLNEPICPRFVVEFYHSLKVKRDEELRPYIEFKLGQFTFKLTPSRLSQILQTPHALETFYSSKWSLNSLDDHPKSNFFGPKHDLVKKAITTPRTTQAQLLRDPNKLYTDDIRPDLKSGTFL